MNAVQRARLMYSNNQRGGLSTLRSVDVKRAVRVRSLEQLQSITNMCEQIKLTPQQFQHQSAQNKLKFLQAYQFSIIYSRNLKQIYSQKQQQIQNQHKKLKFQLQKKVNAIRTHKKKVQKMKEEYREMKVQQAKNTCKQLEQKVANMKHQQDQLNEEKYKLQRKLDDIKRQLARPVNNAPPVVYYMGYPPPPANYQGHPQQNLEYNGHPQNNQYPQNNAHQQFYAQQNENPNNFNLHHKGDSLGMYNNMGSTKTAGFENSGNLAPKSSKFTKSVSPGKNQSPTQTNPMMNSVVEINLQNSISRSNLNLPDLIQQEDEPMQSQIGQRASIKNKPMQGFQKNPKHSETCFDQFNQEEQKIKLSRQNKKSSQQLRIIDQPQIQEIQLDSSFTNKINQERIDKHGPSSPRAQEKNDFLNQQLKTSQNSRKSGSQQASKNEIRGSKQSLVDNDEHNDKVHALQSGVSPIISSKGSRISQASRISKRPSSIAKPPDSVMLQDDPSFFKIRMEMDSNINSDRQVLMNSQSGIEDAQGRNSQPIINLKGQKRKSQQEIESLNQKNNTNIRDSYDSMNLEVSTKSAKQQLSLSKSKEKIPTQNLNYYKIQDASGNLFQSTKGIANSGSGQKNDVNYLNGPLIKKSSSKLDSTDLKGSADSFTFKTSQNPKSAENQQKYPVKQDAIDDIEDDDMDMGKLGEDSNISLKNKKKSQEENKPLPPTTTSTTKKISLKQKLDEVIEEQDSESAANESNRIMPKPPSMQKQPVHDEENYEDDFQISLPSNPSGLHNKPAIEANKSAVDISVSSPNVSINEVEGPKNPFQPLVQQRFQLRPQYANMKQSNTQSNGTFAQILQSKYLKNPLNQSNVEIRGIKTEEDEEMNDDQDMDFLDNFGQYSVMGKRPQGLRKTGIRPSIQDQSGRSQINLRIIDNQKNIISSESMNRSLSRLSKDQDEDLFLIMNRSLESIDLDRQSDPNRRNPSTVQLIQSTTFNNVSQLKGSKSLEDSQKLLQLNNASVLQSKTGRLGSSSYELDRKSGKYLNSKQQQSQSIAEQQIQQELQLSIQDNSRVHQSEKQQIQMKIIKILRNKEKYSKKLLSHTSKNISAQAQILIEKQIQETTKSKTKNWAQIEHLYAKKISDLKQKNKQSQTIVKSKISEIEEKNVRQRQQKQEKKKEMEDEQLQLDYSQSIIKNSMKRQSYRKNSDSLQNIDLPEKTIHKIPNVSGVDNDLTVSLPLKSIAEVRNPNQNDNDSLMLDELPQNTIKKPNTQNQSNMQSSDMYDLPQRSKFIRNQSIEQQRGNNLMSSNQNSAQMQSSKSKYVKLASQSSKSIPKENTVSRLVQSKYISIEDPLNNQLNMNKNLNYKVSKKQDDDEDF